MQSLQQHRTCTPSLNSPASRNIIPKKNVQLSNEKKTNACDISSSFSETYTYPLHTTNLNYIIINLWWPLNRSSSEKNFPCTHQKPTRSKGTEREQTQEKMLQADVKMVSAQSNLCPPRDDQTRHRSPSPYISSKPATNISSQSPATVNFTQTIKQIFNKKNIFLRFQTEEFSYTKINFHFPSWKWTTIIDKKSHSKISIPYVAGAQKPHVSFTPLFHK